MSEARANTRRPTSEAGTAEDPSDGEGVADSERRGEPGAAGVTAARQRSSRRQTKDVVVSGRLADEDAEDFAFVRSSFGASSASETIREVVRIAATVLRGDEFKTIQANQMPGPELDAVTVAAMHEALRVNAQAHSQVAFQLQKIGNNLNQIARAANAGDTVPADALAALRRPLEEIEAQLARDARRDGERAAKLRRMV